MVAVPTNLTEQGVVSIGANRTAVILTHSDNIVEYIEGAFVDNASTGVQLYTEFDKDLNRFEWVMYMAYGFDYFFPSVTGIGYKHTG